MIRKSIILFISTFYFLLNSPSESVWAQTKKVLDPSDFARWKDIENKSISGNGELVLYQLQPPQQDSELVVYHNDNYLRFPRGVEGKFSYHSDYVFFKIKPHQDTVRAQKRRGIEEDKLPKDSLAIWNVNLQSLIKVPDVRNFKHPEKTGGWLAYQLDAVVSENDTLKTDSTNTNQKKAKKQNKENGFTLIIKDLATSRQDTFPFVLDYHFAKKGGALIFNSTGNDSLFLPGVYRFDLEERNLLPLTRGRGKFLFPTLSNQSQQAAFLADLDTTKNRIRNFGLYYWQNGQDSANLVIDSLHQNMPEDWIVNQHHGIDFSDDGTKVFFHISPKPLLEDTTLLEEEKISVEVWNWKDTYLQTQQEVEKEKAGKMGYLAVYHPDNSSFVPLSDANLNQVKLTSDKNSESALLYTNLPYGQLITWEGFPRYYDIYSVDLETGNRDLVATKVKGEPDISPEGEYIYWYEVSDTAWFVHTILEQETRNLTKETGIRVDNELHDQPDFPDAYGSAGWSENDRYFLIYDRYDLWRLDPKQSEAPLRLTLNGREDKITYRYRHLNPDQYYVDLRSPLYLSGFNHRTKGEGYYRLELNERYLKAPVQLIGGDFLLAGLNKARDNEDVIFTRESFTAFPDIYKSTLRFRKIEQVSFANPQQSEYRWGTSELVSWTSLDGKPLQGILVKPDDFDPGKKYPMIVYFYERNSDNLHRHYPAKAHRSIINYSVYASRGYVIFIPDIVYEDGYPGQSAYNSIMPGVTKIVEKGFVDEKNIGIQGHSWGGYQVSYLVTRTNLFKAAEAGAPVANMISAYGGIRWETGYSRMFQYEHTQSRLGGTPWEKPFRYLENSPIFFLDKIETPLLIMHNDQDGHVPWYQGIELFVGLRRLGKPAWMLNYNKEPHWPLKYAHMVDFNIRMQQFFDHYLKGAPVPEWMEEGIPAVEKGINFGYELIEE